MIEIVALVNILRKEVRTEIFMIGKNKNLFSITTQKSLITFCYHEQFFCDEVPMEYQVATGSHDSIVEAIIGAIYLDRGLDKARQWIYKNIICDITKEN